MGGTGVSLDADLRIPPNAVSVGLVFLGAVLVFTHPLWPDSSGELGALLLALMLYASGLAVWLVSAWKPRSSRGFTIVLLILLIGLAQLWLGVPGTTALFVVPTGLAIAMMSSGAGVIVAVFETALVVILQLLAVGSGGQLTASGRGWASVGVSITAIWATLGVACGICRAGIRVVEWSEVYYRDARKMFDMARDREMELGQALDDLAHANRQLALASERHAGLRLIAEEARKTKAAFVAKVSHEFRTPLNMIIGLTDLLVETPEVYGQELPPGLIEDLDIVHRNCDHLSSLVNDVLDLSQAEIGRLTLRREHVDLVELTDEAVAVVRPLLEKKNLSLKIDALQPDELPAVLCDRTRIRQVILNLISNAARYTEQGGIVVRLARQNQRIVVSISDTGPGIHPEDVERIFEPFCQGRGELWQDKGGSGLGLSICKQFLELHGGRIWLESELSVGTTSYFDLPIGTPIAHTARPDRWIREDWVWRERHTRAAPPEELFRPRIIVCDGTGDLQPALGRYSDEVELVDTRDWPEAMDELRCCPAHAVMINAALPELWARVMAAQSELPDTPVIGCHVPPRTARAAQAGAADYLVKPVTQTQLTGSIARLAKRVGHVLVVDDEPDVVRLLTRMLHASDRALKVTTASCGTEALEKLMVEHPDLMLLDVMMPDIDGWAVLELKKRDTTIEEIPVILVSAHDPMDQPLTSEALVATVSGGISLSKLLRCSIGLSSVMLQPD